MTTGFDVLRYLIRGGRPNTEENQRIALLAIDAWEKGYADAETYQAELDKQVAAAAAGAPAPAPGLSDAERAAVAEAENVRLQALLGARAGKQAAPAEPAEANASEATTAAEAAPARAKATPKGTR